MQDAHNQPDVVNRPNSEGETPLQLACSNNDEWKAILLWTAGAELGEDQTTKSFLEKNTFMHPLGIQHVVECSALVDLLKNWSAATNEEKEEAEQKIKDLFSNDLKLIFVPISEVEEEKKEELKKNMKEWNRSHTMKGERGRV